MNVLTIDVAITKPTAYALFLNDELSFYEKVPSIIEVGNLILARPYIDLIITEDMYLGMNVETLKKLCYEVGKVIYIADLHNIKYILIGPHNWEAHHGLLKKKYEYFKTLKKQIILNETGVETDDVDIQSAILMGLYVIERMRLGLEME